MAADPGNTCAPQIRIALPSAGVEARQFGLRRWWCALSSLILIVGQVGVARGSEPYASALDKQFSTAPAQPDSSDPGVAALEAGIKRQAQEMAQRPEPSPEGPTERMEQFFLCGLGVVAALGASLFALIALRRWNHWLDKKAARRELARNSLAEDPVMAEFIHTLHEELWSGPVAVPSASSEPTATLPAPTTTAQEPSASQLPPQGPVMGGNNLALLRAELQRLSRAPDDDERLRVLRGLVGGVELIKQNSDSPHLRPARLVATALHGLLKQLSLKAAHVTPSILRTAAAALDLLEFLGTRTPRPDLANTPPVRLLAVDDEPISLRAVTFALKKAFHGADAAVDGQSAMALLVQQPYDVIFLDIEMPGMDGFELCAKIRETAANRATPVVFVTSHTDFDSRAKSAMLGAQDLIAKPFLAFEITLKALTLVLRAREERESNSALNERDKADLKMSSAAPAVIGATVAAAAASAHPPQPAIV